MTRYLFYNAHGPKVGLDSVADLAATRDADTVLVPIDWTPESDANRDAILKEIGLAGISSLPCVVHFEPSHDEDDAEGGKITVPDRWVEHRLAERAKADWTWAKIDRDIAERQPTKLTTRG